MSGSSSRTVRGSQAVLLGGGEQIALAVAHHPRPGDRGLAEAGGVVGRGGQRAGGQAGPLAR